MKPVRKQILEMRKQKSTTKTYDCHVFGHSGAYAEWTEVDIKLKKMMVINKNNF